MANLDSKGKMAVKAGIANMERAAMAGKVGMAFSEAAKVVTEEMQSKGYYEKATITGVDQAAIEPA